MHQIVAIQNEVSPEMPSSGENPRFFVSCDLKNWLMTLKNKKAALSCYFKLCASFNSHHWIQTGITVRKRTIWVKKGDFFVNCDLEIWRMTFENNKAPLPWYFKLSVSFCNHWWIQTWVAVRKRPILVNIGEFLLPVTLKIDGWP